MLVCSLEFQSWILSSWENGLSENLLESFRKTIKIFDPTNHWLFVCNFAVFVSLQFVMQTGWGHKQYFHFLSSPGQVWSKLFINISRNFDTLRLNIFWDLFEKFLVLFNRVDIHSKRYTSLQTVFSVTVYLKRLLVLLGLGNHDPNVHMFMRSMSTEWIRYMLTTHGLDSYFFPKWDNKQIKVYQFTA